MGTFFLVKPVFFAGPENFAQSNFPSQKAATGAGFGIK
jgi:hypothetical protein